MSFVQSADGPVFVELFKFRDTYGVPLGSVMRWLRDDGILFSVPHFIRDAVEAGWSKRKVRAELRAAWLELLPAKDVEALTDLADVFLGKLRGA